MTDPEEEFSLTPPSEERVQRRAWALSCVVCRAFMESFDDAAEAATLQSRILSWIDAIDLRSEFEPSEITMIEADIGVLSPQDVANGSWRSEGLAVLAWALARNELPAHDVMVDPSAAANSVLFLAEDALDRRHELRLRSADELAKLSAVQLALHWRLREFSLRATPLDFRKFVETAWFGPLSIEGVELAENDLAIDGVPLSKAPVDRFQQCRSIAMERHQAINWLSGWDEIYSEVDTST